MSNFMPSGRDRAFLLPPDLRSWIPTDDVVHFVVAAVERVPTFILQGFDGYGSAAADDSRVRGRYDAHGRTGQRLGPKLR